ncbi:hypothetical protein BD626DRAFT_483417 [Schizophyllum amplum]|uniref:Uncharacterized protein n=1 Tax=Schizophyllum amplum TaxID=97359 RepID=A0A550CPD1_9AGAR|nr:hypothetical protein BD626DRAFT_483417 [Auriculariopsis ampla]
MPFYRELRSLVSTRNKGGSWVDSARLDSALDARVLRQDNDGRFELILGLSLDNRQGAQLLITEDEYHALCRATRTQQSARQFSRANFTLLSPVACSRAEILAKLKPGKGGSGYALLEQGRTLRHVLHNPSDADRFCVPRFRSDEFRVLAFAYNLVYTEQPEHLKLAQPKIKDVGIAEVDMGLAEAHANGGSAQAGVTDTGNDWTSIQGSVKHYLNATNVGLRQVEQDPDASGAQREVRAEQEDMEGTQTLPQDQFDIHSYFDLHKPNARPVILLVANARFALAVLQALGVRIEGWKTDLHELFGRPSDSEDVYGAGRSRSPRRAYQGEGGGYPAERRGYGEERRGYPGERRGYSDDRRGYTGHGRGYSGDGRGYPGDIYSSNRNHDQRDARRPESDAYSRRPAPNVYVVDVKEAFVAYHASTQDAIGVRRMAKHAGLVADAQRWCAGVEARLLIDLWKILICLPSTSFPMQVRQDAWNRWKASAGAVGNATAVQPGPASAAAGEGDGSDSEDDLNAVALGPAAPAPAMGGGDPYLDDFSDHGNSDDDDDD